MEVARNVRTDLKRHDSPTGTSPVRPRARARPSVSHLAYARGWALRCTAWAASLVDIDCQLGSWDNTAKNAPAAYAGFCSCRGVPHPLDGRCWNAPSESKSPWSRLRSPDSCSAVARPTVTAWLGSPMRFAVAAMVVATAACSGVSL